jgi:hypothetical protein
MVESYRWSITKKGWATNEIGIAQFTIVCTARTANTPSSNTMSINVKQQDPMQIQYHNDNNRGGILVYNIKANDQSK